MYTEQYYNEDYRRFKHLCKYFGEASFEVRKEEVLKTEERIRGLVGNNPDYPNFVEEADKKLELALLLSQRKTLLDWMFLETPVETERMKVLNERLFTLTNRLRKKVEDVRAKMYNSERDDFDDDFEVEGTLMFSYNGIESVLAYEGDDVYGCDYPLMVVANDFYNDYKNTEYYRLSSVSLDDGVSWAHETAGNFDGICICHTTAVFCRDLGYPLVDVLHMNDFWNEVHVRYQQFATQDPNYKYPRD